MKGWSSIRDQSSHLSRVGDPDQYGHECGTPSLNMAMCPMCEFASYNNWITILAFHIIHLQAFPKIVTDAEGAAMSHPPHRAEMYIVNP